MNLLKISRNIVRSSLIVIANALANYEDFSFPAKFTWKWKLDMLLQMYERDTTVLFKKTIKPGMTVIDIGAHIGYYTRLFSTLVGPQGAVYAFEADRDNFALLQKNTRSCANVRLYNQAVTDTVGIIDFYKIAGSTGCHSVIAAENAEKVATRATTLDAFIEANGIRTVNSIKIDIEGGEALAFAGMQKLLLDQRNIAIVSELNPTALKSADVEPLEFIQNMRNNGFEIFMIFKNGKLKLFDGLQNLKFYRTGYVNVLFKKTDVRQ